MIETGVTILVWGCVMSLFFLMVALFPSLFLAAWKHGLLLLFVFINYVLLFVCINYRWDRLWMGGACPLKLPQPWQLGRGFRSRMVNVPTVSCSFLWFLSFICYYVFSHFSFCYFTYYLIKPLELSPFDFWTIYVVFSLAGRSSGRVGYRHVGGGHGVMEVLVLGLWVIDLWIIRK